MATVHSPAAKPESLAARVPAACFKIASFTAVIGISLGVYMGMGRDHTLAPVHVHLNLIGWVSLFLFGIFYKTHPSAIGKAPIAQVGMSVAGYVAMLSGLAGFLLTSSPAFMPPAICGSLLVWAGVLLFFIIVARIRCIVTPFRHSCSVFARNRSG